MKASEYLLKKNLIYENNGFKIGLDGDSNVTDIITELDAMFIDKENISKNLIDIMVSHRRILNFPSSRYHDLEGILLESMVKRLSEGVNICNVSMDEIKGTLLGYNIHVNEDVASIDSIFGIKIDRVRFMIDWFITQSLKPSDIDFEDKLKRMNIV